MLYASSAQNLKTIQQNKTKESYMSEKQGIRISRVVKQFNIGIGTLTDFLKENGIDVDPSPNSKISRMLMLLLKKNSTKSWSLRKNLEKSSWKWKMSFKMTLLLHLRRLGTEGGTESGPKTELKAEPKLSPSPSPNRNQNRNPNRNQRRRRKRPQNGTKSRAQAWAQARAQTGTKKTRAETEKGSWACKQRKTNCQNKRGRSRPRSIRENWPHSIWQSRCNKEKTAEESPKEEKPEKRQKTAAKPKAAAKPKEKERSKRQKQQLFLNQNLSIFIQEVEN